MASERGLERPLGADCITDCITDRKDGKGLPKNKQDGKTVFCRNIMVIHESRQHKPVRRQTEGRHDNVEELNDCEYDKSKQMPTPIACVCVLDARSKRRNAPRITSPE